MPGGVGVGGCEGADGGRGGEGYLPTPTWGKIRMVSG